MRVSFHPNFNTKICLLLATLLMLCAPILVSAQVPAQSKVNYVALGAANARETLRCASASFQYEQFTPHEYNYFWPEPAGNSVMRYDPTQDVQEKVNVWWHISDQKLAMFIQQQSAGSIWSYERLVSDGRKARTVAQYNDPENPQNGIYYTGAEGPPSLWIDDYGVWKEHFSLDPRFDVYMPYDSTQFQDAGQEEVFGSLCFKLKKESADEIEFFWVDAEHDFLLRKRATYDKKMGKNMFVGQTTVPRLQSSNGRWFPGLVEFQFTLVMRADKLPAQMPRERLTMEGDWAVLPAKTGRIEYSNFESGPVQSPATYILDWPNQTQVYDHFTKEAYVVDGVARAKSVDASTVPKAADALEN